MEPVFMALGHAASAAACQAIDRKVSLQQVNVKKLQERLRIEKQVLEWTK
jgi:hypothetical protein